MFNITTGGLGLGVEGPLTTPMFKYETALKLITNKWTLRFCTVRGFTALSRPKRHTSVDDLVPRLRCAPLLDAAARARECRTL